MVFLPPMEAFPGTAVNEEAFRFSQKLPLILTKFTPPRSPGVLVQRERLIQRLDSAASGTLTLLCAGAGFGKTTLLAQWYRHRQRQGDALAWLSLEEDESEPLLFMRYLLGALRPLYPHWNSTFEGYFAGHLPGDFSLFIAELINQLHLCPHPLYLILDDYQSIRSREIHDGLTALVHHAPSSLHLVIGSRHQPPLAPGRLQIQERLVELCADDLRFSADEAHAWFTGAEAPAVNNREIQQIVAATEGWAAGMKMALLSTRSHAITCPLAGHLSAGSPSVTRYFQEVIFAPLPAEVLDFLLKTSVLNRLNPALCNAVTGQHNGQAMLAWIAQHNLFLTSLDDGGFWFRYHPLMRDALLNHLQHSAQCDIPLLHERAGNWFAARQLWAEAMRHALASGQSASPHAEAGAQSLAEEGDIDTMVQWINHLPATVDPAHIELQINLAWALAHHFRFHDARQMLDAIDAQIADDPERLGHSTRVKLRVVRAICEAFAENISRSIAIVEPLLREIPCGDIWVDGLVCNILSYCHLALFRPQQAIDIQLRLARTRQANRNLFVDVYRAFVVAQGYLRQGNLYEAQRQASEALHHAQQHTGAHASSGATLAPILAEIAWEQGNMTQIDELLTPRLPMIDSVCSPDGFSRCYIVLARQALLNDRIADADALLLHAEQLTAQRGWLRAQVALMAERLILRLKTGETDEARRLLTQLEQRVQAAQAESEDVLCWYVARCQSHLLIATGELLAAAEILSALVLAQEQRGEALLALQSRLLLAVTLWRAGETERAADSCKPLLQRAVQQQLLRSLLDAGPALPLLLAHMRAQQVLDMLPQRDTAGSSPLRLTEREQQILRLIAEGLSNKSIARPLGISVETVKWHLKQLYEKLQVNGRIQAVNQARKWGVL